MRVRWGSVLSSLLVGALAACSPVENAPAPGLVAALDEPVFRCRIEPILVRASDFRPTMLLGVVVGVFRRL